MQCSVCLAFASPTLPLLDQNAVNNSWSVFPPKMSYLRTNSDWAFVSLLGSCHREIPKKSGSQIHMRHPARWKFCILPDRRRGRLLESNDPNRLPSFVLSVFCLKRPADKPEVVTEDVNTLTAYFFLKIFEDWCRMKLFPCISSNLSVSDGSFPTF